MKQSNKAIVFAGALYTVSFYPLGYDFTFLIGALTLGILFSAHKYYLIKEVLCGEHEELVEFLEKRIDDEEITEERD